MSIDFSSKCSIANRHILIGESALLSQAFTYTNYADTNVHTIHVQVVTTLGVMYLLMYYHT